MYIEIKKNISKSMTKQIYDQIKKMILNGKLKPNEKLPSSRKLAEDLNVSRNVIVESYEMLNIEGYTRSLKGSGNYVNENVAITIFPQKNIKIKLLEDKNIDKCINFQSGLPALDKFPRHKWLQCYKEAINEIPDNDLGYDFSNGYTPFRKILAKYLYRSRGIKCHEDQIVVTTGAAQGFFILAQYFKKQKGFVLLEEPTTKGVRDIFEFNDLNFICHPIDNFGINPKTLPKNEKLSCIFVTPSHQYPLGSSLPVSRRIELIKYARQNNCYIIEDDYDSEYRYDNLPVESLQELDSEKVIYLGSFSKILLPSIRIGYMVLPVELIEKIYKIKHLIDIHCPVMNQAAMKKFIEKGYLEQHILKSKKIYRKRRSILINNLKSKFGDKVRILGKETGIHLVAEFENFNFTENFLNKLIENKVFIVSVSEHTFISGTHKSKLIFGYGNLNEENIKKGVERFFYCVQKYLK